MGNSSNLVRLAIIPEVTRGTIPASPRYRNLRFTGESLKLDQKYKDSEEIRADRMEADPIPVNLEVSGGINTELFFPKNLGPASNLFASLAYNPWAVTNERDNDGTAASAITGISTTTITVASGTAFASGNIIYASGMNAAANNGLFVLTGGSSTTAVTTGLTTDATPAAAARIKLVGTQGVSGDIVATTAGLTSTTLNFTTLPLVVGQWIKLFNFATTADNAFVRVVSIAANALGLDNLPTGWAADAGTGKTIQIFYGDRLYNGLVEYPLSIERAFLGQAAPTYIINGGAIVDKYTLTMTSGDTIKQAWEFMGTAFQQNTTANGASYVNADETALAMGANRNVGVINDAGSSLRSTDPVKSITLEYSNGQMAVLAVDAVAPIDTTYGSAAVTGTLELNFFDNSMLSKYVNSTASSLSARANRNSQAVIWTLPRVTYNADGQPNATARNNQVIQKLGFKASYDSVTGTQWSIDRFEQYQ